MLRRNMLRGVARLGRYASEPTRRRATPHDTHSRRTLAAAAAGKLCKTPADALRGLESSHTLLVGGFGLSGVPERLLEAVVEAGAKNLTVVSSNAGTDTRGLGLLYQARCVSKVVGAYIGENDELERQFLAGELELELVPMGTLAERMRAAGAGIPAFYTRTGAGTLVHRGGLPTRYAAADGGAGAGVTVAAASAPHEAREFTHPLRGGAPSEYVLEHALAGDFALVKAWKADPEGNLVYRKTARNHNPAVATAGRVTVAEVEELVPLGAIPPDEVHTPGIYVDRVVVAPRMGVIERLTLADDETSSSFSPSTNPAHALRERIVRRAALELSEGDYVNLGIGMPTLVSNYVPKGVDITLQSENGMLGVGPFPRRGDEDCDLINAGKQTVTELPGASYFSACQSFAMIRGGYCDVTVLGSMQVAANGDMANYLIPGKLVKGMGGAMDLVASGSRVIVTMEHTDRNGRPKVLDRCTLPLTGERVVSLIITERAVFEVGKGPGGGLLLVEMAETETIDSLRAATDANFSVSDDLRPIRQA